jgi:hypothetical protein
MDNSVLLQESVPHLPLPGSYHDFLKKYRFFMVFFTLGRNEQLMPLII